MSKKPSDKILHSNPWCRYLERTTAYSSEPHYVIASQDYLGVVAKTPSGLYPLVYQYRAAADKMTCELPAGTIEPGETPKDAAIRELKEETGLDAKTIQYLGSHCSDSGRLTNRIHSFFAETNEPDPNFKPEPGMRVEFVTREELLRRAHGGEIDQLLHLGTLFLALEK